MPRREAAAQALALGTALPAVVQVAEVGFVEPRLVAATLEAGRATAAAHAGGEGSGAGSGEGSGGQGAGSAGGEAEAGADGHGEDSGGAPREAAVEGERWAAGELTLTLTIDGAVGAAGTPLVFSRADEAALWFVDPWARGALLPPSACEAALTHLGVPPAEHAGATAAISPTRVWARMLRNLQATHELPTAANCIRMPHTWPTGMVSVSFQPGARASRLCRGALLGGRWRGARWACGLQARAVGWRSADEIKSTNPVPCFLPSAATRTPARHRAAAPRSAQHLVRHAASTTLTAASSW